jgi:hypothetical protein
MSRKGQKEGAIMAKQASNISISVSDLPEDELKRLLRDELTAYKFVVVDAEHKPMFITISAERAYELACELETYGATYFPVSDYLNPKADDDTDEYIGFDKVYDDISNPKHYCYSKFEPKDVIREWGLNFNLGNAVKYIARAGRKDDIIKDLQKAKQYIEFELDYLEKQK